MLGVNHAEPPLYPETFRVPVTNEKVAIAPCGKDCSDCPNYLIDEGPGCPVTIHYRGSFNRLQDKLSGPGFPRPCF